MKLSATEEYGLRCLIQVFRLDEGLPVPVQAIAAAEGMSADYAAKILRTLREGGLVISTRGANGGYRLARPAPTITVIEVLTALDGPLVDDGWCTRHSGQHDTCVHGSDCTVEALWRFIGSTLQDALSTVSLADLAGGRVQLLNLLRAHNSAAPSPSRTEPASPRAEASDA